MMLTNTKKYPEYYLPEDKSFFVFIKDSEYYTKESKLDLKIAFTSGFEYKFWLIFFQNNLNINTSLTNYLKSNLNIPKISWIDDLSKPNERSEITLNNNSKIIGYNLEVGFNSDFYFNNTDQFGNQISAIIEATDISLKIKVNPTGSHLFKTRRYEELLFNEEELSFNEVEIPLTSAFQSKINKNINSIGSLCFKPIKLSEKFIQPTSNLVSSLKDKPDYISKIYFVKKSEFDNIDFDIEFYPTKKMDNIRDDNFKKSYYKISFNSDSKSNIINSNSERFLFRKGTSIINTILFIDNENDPTKSKHFFSPIPQEITLIRPSQKAKSGDNTELLIGNSGTERIKIVPSSKNEIKLQFVDFEDLKIEQGTDKVELTTLNGSKTSILVPIGTSTEYFNDTQQLPSFENSISSDYKAIKLGDYSELVPIIPTLCIHPDKSELINIDTLLNKYRFEQFNGSKNINSNQITPKGFIKNTKSSKKKSGAPSITYDFIKNETNKSIGQASFRITDTLGDIDKSLNAEEVFFAITPELWNIYLKQAKGSKLEISFPINNDANAKFSVDLSQIFLNNEIANPLKEPLIIFKFGKKPFSDFLDNVASWSNHGFVKDNQKLGKINDTLKKTVQINDSYIKNNFGGTNVWNGVFLVNVPMNQDPEKVPPVIAKLFSSDPDYFKKNELKEQFKFDYIAFPISKTKVDGGSVVLESTGYNALINYNPLANKTDYDNISTFLKEEEFRYVLTKLKVVFTNSAITTFESFAFLKLKELFEDGEIESATKAVLKNDGNEGTDELDKTIRLQGSFNRNDKGDGVISFALESNFVLKFPQKSIISQLAINKVACAVEADIFRFDIDALPSFNQIGTNTFFDELEFKNIGLNFGSKNIFDWSRLIVIPKFSFGGGNSFLSNFPLKFNSFRVFEIKNKTVIDFDFLDLFKLDQIPNPDPFEIDKSLFSFIFDFDLGNLGNLQMLKAFKGLICIGWSPSGGFKLGFKLAERTDKGIHFDLSGAVKVDIEEVGYGQDKIAKKFFLILKEASITFLNKYKFPKKNKFSGYIVTDAKFSNIAWLIASTDNEDNNLLFGLGQKVATAPGNTVSEILKNSTKVFKIDPPDPEKEPIITINEKNNWFVGSNDLLALLELDSWKSIIDLKFVFNDPSLYGLYFELEKFGFSTSIVYRKISDTQGEYAIEIVLPDNIRKYPNYGSPMLILPNLGVNIGTNGSWKVDAGFPSTPDNWQRSGRFQLDSFPPLTGFFGMYLSKTNDISQTLFSEYLRAYNPLDPSKNDLKVLQAGFAFRIGIGKYFEFGILKIDASITFFGTFEGALAYDNNTSQTTGLFPDHFAFYGICGAIAEVTGTVDFCIIQASVHFQFMLYSSLKLAYFSSETKPNTLIGLNGKEISRGLQPAIIAIGGSVRASASIKIGCVRYSFRFETSITFTFKIGGGNNSKKQIARTKQKTPIKINSIKYLPYIYLPTFTRTWEEDKTQKVLLVHTFLIPFAKDPKTGEFGEINIFKDKIIVPMFKDILNGSISLNELKEDLQESEFVLPNFKPTIVKGINTSDLNVINSIITNPDLGFGYDLNVFEKSILDTYNDKSELLYLSQAPISSTIAVFDPILNVFTEIRDPEITISDLLIDENQTSKIKKTFGKIEKYTESDLDYMNGFFDNLKTQFVDRPITNRKVKVTNPDFRKKVAINEYFKLIANFTLEELYEKWNGSEENRIEDPQISRDGDIFVLKGIKTVKNISINDILENVIGRLNYFYKSGLRLPEKSGVKNTSSIFELLEQSQPLDFSTPGVTKPGKIPKIELSGFDITNDVGELGGIQDTANSYAKGSSFNIDTLASEFSEIEIIKPYNLNPIKLGLSKASFTKFQLSNLGKLEYFINTPERLKVDKPNYFYDLNLHKVDDTGTKDIGKIIKYAHILPIKVNIVGEQIDKGRIAEIANVSVMSQIELNKLKDSSLNITEIKLLKKRTDTITNEQVYIEIDISKGLTIVKSNLSPRTYPPSGILNRKIKKVAIQSSQVYSSEFTNTKDFINILWEACTTNNGKYFLIFKDNNLISPNDELFIFASFSTDIDNGRLPSWANTLHVVDDISTELSKFNEAPFCLADIKISNESSGQLVDLLEYQPTMVSSAFGFILERKPEKNSILKAGQEYLNTPYNKYLPIEIEVLDNSGKAIIDKDSTLPIMPTGKNDLIYSNICSLDQTLEKINNVNAIRKTDNYGAIGKTFKLNVGIRDVFGFRGMPRANLKSIEYTHYYNDNIISLNNWPFTKFYYVFNVEEKGILKFDLKREIAYVEPDGSALVEINNTIATIKKQLNDKRLNVDLDGFITENPESDIRSILLGVLVDLEDIIKTKNGTAQTKKVCLFGIELKDKLMVPLNPIVKITRKIDYSLSRNPNYKNLENFNIWGYNDTFKLDTELEFGTPGKKDEFNKLNDSLKKSDKCVGISRKEFNKQQIYIVDSSIFGKEDVTLNSSKNYIGIKPFSNNLWSGEVELLNKRLQKVNNVDVDLSLRLVLKKLNELVLSPKYLLIDDYITDCHKALINTKKYFSEILSEYLTMAMATSGDEVNSKSKLEFKNLLLDNLDLFYNYDGVVCCKIDDRSVTKKSLSGLLENHRLNLKIEANEKYNLYSSKIENYNNKNNPSENGIYWNVFFDSLKDHLVSFQMSPLITHVEKTESTTEVLQKSEWIELIKPIPFLKNKEVVVKDWPLITRKFPKTPTIINHSCKPKSPVATSDDIGKWNYQLELELQDLAHGDILEISVTPQVSKRSVTGDLIPKIVKWAKEIESGKLEPNTQIVKNINSFCDDFKPTKFKVSSQERISEKRGYIFQYDSKNWKIIKGNTEAKLVLIGEKYIFISEEYNLVQNIESSIINSEIVLIRNGVDGLNEKFKYRTAPISPSTALEPMLHYSSPIELSENDFNRFINKFQNVHYKVLLKQVICADKSGNNWKKLFNLPTNPIKLYEHYDYSIIDAESIFRNYSSANGFSAISLTIYSQQGSLPIIIVENLVKVK